MSVVDFVRSLVCYGHVYKLCVWTLNARSLSVLTGMMI